MGHQLIIDVTVLLGQGTMIVRYALMVCFGTIGFFQIKELS